MSLIPAILGGLLAFRGVMLGIGGSSSILATIMGWFAALLGIIVALLPVLVFGRIFPRTRDGKPKAKASAVKAAPEKSSKKAAVAEPGSEEMDVAEDDEFAEASDEFSAVSDDELEFGVADEFDEDEKR